MHPAKNLSLGDWEGGVLLVFFFSFSELWISGNKCCYEGVRRGKGEQKLDLILHRPECQGGDSGEQNPPSL